MLVAGGITRPGVGLAPVLHKKFAGRSRPSKNIHQRAAPRTRHRPAAMLQGTRLAQASSLFAMPPRGHGGTEERPAGVPSSLVLASGRPTGEEWTRPVANLQSMDGSSVPHPSHSLSSPSPASSSLFRPSRISHLAELAAIERLGGSAPNGPRECLREGSQSRAIDPGPHPGCWRARRRRNRFSLPLR